MRAHITRAIVGVTAAVLVVLGVPLAIFTQDAIVRAEVLALQRDAMRTVTEISIPIDLGQLNRIAEESDAPPPFGVYDLGGRRVFGAGPDTADDATTRAIGGESASNSSGAPVVAVPLVDAQETVVGVVRISSSASNIDHKTLVAWGVMLGASLVALGLAWGIGRRVASRLARPLVALAAVGEGLALGESWPQRDPSGIAEIDELSEVLHDGATRVIETLARERRFSDDVSHQLRTPITRLRLVLENGSGAGPVGPVTESALEELDRLEATVVDLLGSARGTLPSATSITSGAVLRGIEQRWATRCALAGRVLHVEGPDDLRAVASPALLDQALDVVLDNALRHGKGIVRCSVRRIVGGAAIDIADEGTFDDAVSDEVAFRRGAGTDHGIGLSLARDLVEADGGRLLLTSRTPTVFSFVLLAAPHPPT